MLPRRVWVVIIIILLLAALLSVALLEVKGKPSNSKTPSTTSQDQNPPLLSSATPTSFQPELKMTPATPDFSSNGSNNLTGDPLPTVQQSTKNDVSSPLKEITPSPPRPGKPHEIPNFPIPTSQRGSN